MVILTEQVFQVTFENFGQVSFVPVLDQKYGKLLLCLADADGKILSKSCKNTPIL